jgi:hypothetical protein
VFYLLLIPPVTSMNILLDGYTYWIPYRAILSTQTGRSENEIELIVLSIVSTLIVLWLISTFFGLLCPRRSSLTSSSDVCCVTKFFEKRRASRGGGIVSIPGPTCNGGMPQGLDQFIREVQGLDLVVRKTQQMHEKFRCEIPQFIVREVQLPHGLTLFQAGHEGSNELVS